MRKNCRSDNLIYGSVIFEAFTICFLITSIKNIIYCIVENSLKD